MFFKKKSPASVATAEGIRDKVIVAPGRRSFLAKTKGQSLLFSELFFKPIFFWKNALQTPIFDFGKTWGFHCLNLLILLLEMFANSRKGYLGHLVLSTLFFSVSLSAMIFSSSAFFAFDTLIDSWQGLKNSTRFIFGLSPLLLIGQAVFLIWSGFRHPNPDHYFLISGLTFIYGLSVLVFHSRSAFATTWKKSILFSFVTISPWYLFMTGAMWFLS